MIQPSALGCSLFLETKSSILTGYVAEADREHIDIGASIDADACKLRPDSKGSIPHDWRYSESRWCLDRRNFNQHSASPNRARREQEEVEGESGAAILSVCSNLSARISFLPTQILLFINSARTGHKDEGARKRQC